MADTEKKPRIEASIGSVLSALSVVALLLTAAGHEFWRGYFSYCKAEWIVHNLTPTTMLEQGWAMASDQLVFSLSLCLIGSLGLVNFIQGKVENLLKGPVPKGDKSVKRNKLALLKWFLGLFVTLYAHWVLGVSGWLPKFLQPKLWPATFSICFLVICFFVVLVIMLRRLAPALPETETILRSYISKRGKCVPPCAQNSALQPSSSPWKRKQRV